MGVVLLLLLLATVASAQGREPPKINDPARLHPQARAAFDRWWPRALARAAVLGFGLRVLETERTELRQTWLYASGRTRPGPVVTWTLRSRHLPRDGGAWAWDFGLVLLGRVVWADSGGLTEADRSRVASAYRELGELGEQVGAKWGGAGDSDHLEVRTTWLT